MLAFILRGGKLEHLNCSCSTYFSFLSVLSSELLYVLVLVQIVFLFCLHFYFARTVDCPALSSHGVEKLARRYTNIRGSLRGPSFLSDFFWEVQPKLKANGPDRIAASDSMPMHAMPPWMSTLGLSQSQARNILSLANVIKRNQRAKRICPVTDTSKQFVRVCQVNSSAPSPSHNSFAEAAMGRLAWLKAEKEVGWATNDITTSLLINHGRSEDKT